MTKSTDTCIILPTNPGLKEAYVAILKSAYNEQKNIFLFQDLIAAVRDDCGIAQETAISRCKQLSKLLLLKYVWSGLAGHSYRVQVYSKNDGGEIIQIHNWPEISQLIETQFDGLVECDLVKIRQLSNVNMSMTISDNTQNQIQDVDLEMDALTNASVIHSKTEDKHFQFVSKINHTNSREV